MTREHTSPATRPVTAALRARRRGDDEVLLEGARPGGLVLSGLSRAEATAILTLGPTLQPDQLRRAAVPGRRWSAVAAQLCAAAVALAPVRIGTGRVAVVGSGSVAQEVARALRHSVAEVVTDDVAIARLEHGPTSGRELPDVVVLPAVDALAPWTGGRWQRHGIRQLPVIVSGDQLVVGPLIRPDAGPCLHCLDRHRADRDPAWANWAATRSSSGSIDESVDARPEIAAMAAGLVANVVSGLLSEVPLPAGVSLSMQLPTPRISHHLWPVHPACCAAAGRQETMTG
nr:TOMM precursor leader peptide-binding protein [Flexivirga meconopsidis]